MTLSSTCCISNTAHFFWHDRHRQLLIQITARLYRWLCLRLATCPNQHTSRKTIVTLTCSKSKSAHFYWDAFVRMFQAIFTDRLFFFLLISVSLPLLHHLARWFPSEWRDLKSLPQSAQLNFTHVFSCWARSYRIKFNLQPEHSTSVTCLSLSWRTISFTALLQTVHTLGDIWFSAPVEWTSHICRFRLWTCWYCPLHIEHMCVTLWTSFLCFASNCFVPNILVHVSHWCVLAFGFPKFTAMSTSVLVAACTKVQLSQRQRIFSSLAKFHPSLPTLMASATFRPTFTTWCKIPYRTYTRSPAFCTMNS